MVEISDYHHIHKPTRVPASKGYPQQAYVAGNIISCEECPAADVCKDIGNFRKSCEPGTNNYEKNMSASKCIVSNNLLLAKLIEKE